MNNVIQQADAIIEANKRKEANRFKKQCSKMRAEWKALGLNPISRRYEKYAIEKIMGA